MTKFLNRTEKEIKSRISGELDSISGKEKEAMDRMWERVSKSGVNRRVSSATATAVAVMLASVAATFLIMLAPAQTVKVPAGNRVIIASPGFGPVIAPDPLPVVGTQKKMRTLLAASIQSGMFDSDGRAGQGAPFEAYGSELDYAPGDSSRLTAISESRQGDTIPHGGFDSPKGEAKLNYNPNYTGVEAPVPGVGSTKSADLGESNGDAFSRTNVQVEGVDEGDIVKTDGKYIYRVKGNRILVVEATPNGTMRIAATIESEVPVREIYIDGERLITVGQTEEYHLEKLSMVDDSILPVDKGGNASPTSKVSVYDLSDLTEVRSIRKLAFPGHSISSRKIGDKLYLVTSSQVEAESRGSSPDALTFAQPQYKDSFVGEDAIDVPLDDISYIPGKEQAPSYITVAGIDVQGEQEKAEITTLLGDGSMLYASQGNLYVSRISYNGGGSASMESGAPTPRSSRVGLDVGDAFGSVSTDVYRFTLSEGKAVYSGKGDFPGTLLNQYSMDEHDGHLRVAATKEGSDGSSSSVFVLDSDLKITGKIEGIAPGERIYSARFMGDRAYLVTFRETDPFFVISLERPDAPKLLGKLKLPGVSEYLHPYDKDYIIGIGRGSDDEGIKISMFDVTDVAHPVESSKAIIGHRGSSTEVGSNPKALLFSAERKLLALPALVIGEQGQPSFNGLYVYRVDENGFKYRGRISHTPAEWPNGGYGSGIDRALYIEDMLYSFSESLIKQNRLENLSEVSSLSLP